VKLLQIIGSNPHLTEKSIGKFLAHTAWLYEPQQEEPLRRLPLARAVCTAAVYVGYSVGDVITQENDSSSPHNGPLKMPPNSTSNILFVGPMYTRETADFSMGS